MAEIYNKFSLSQKENVFLAKRNIIDNIYKIGRRQFISHPSLTFQNAF